MKMGSSKSCKLLTTGLITSLLFLIYWLTDQREREVGESKTQIDLKVTWVGGEHASLRLQLRRTSSEFNFKTICDS